MKKQYVLTHQEYLSLCNKLETISVDVSFVEKKLSAEQQKEVGPVLVSIKDKVNHLMENFGWR